MINKVFHYTSIDTLEEILRNQTIRFSRFDQMDDKTETQGLPENMRLNYFLSCWSGKQRESIPQWCLYGNGVRIELPQKWYVVERDKKLQKILPEDHPGRQHFFPFHRDYCFRDPRHFSPPTNEGEGFFVKVEYTDNFFEMKKSELSDTPLMGNGRPYGSYGGRYMYNFGDPIKYKDTIWQFQKEYRYYLFAIRGGEQCVDEEETFIDLPINVDALPKIKIRLYPNCTEEDKSKVRVLIERYLPELDPNNCIQESELTGKYIQKNWE